MASDGKINIYITEGDADGISSGGEKNDEKAANKKETAFSRYIQHEVFHLIKGEAKQLASWGANNFGHFTGDYVAAKNMQASLGLLGKCLNIAAAGVAGAKYGAAGAVIGAGVATLTIATNEVLNFVTYFEEVRRNNYSIKLLRERSGLDSLTNGSRGTEN